VVEAAAVPRERSGIEGRDSGGGEGERRWRDPCPRGAKRLDDDVEDLAVVVVVLDVLLMVRRGVALARRLLRSWTSVRAP
jgi:hypothetical protein